MTVLVGNVGIPAPAPVSALSALLDRAVAGDVEAAAAVYDEVSAPAYRLVVLVVGDPDVAHDVCRRAFGHVWEVWGDASLSAGRGAGARTWLLMTVHRFATDHVRLARGGAPRSPLGGYVHDSLPPLGVPPTS